MYGARALASDCEVLRTIAGTALRIIAWCAPFPALAGREDSLAAPAAGLVRSLLPIDAAGGFLDVGYSEPKLVVVFVEIPVLVELVGQDLTAWGPWRTKKTLSA
ncbi:hypothetical protein EYZ11_013091 [Aspergillus tanneri]|uniref:Uncharacterized protein n=1 Tax=Aspergillus tanneri TaxID=1220188 RepID=A0A4S3IYM0_9EURO|nr:hypothetical protein EYZ11_013091 [Aspergillus tanneri]